MADPTPDVAAFVAAQDRLRAQLGTEVTFLTPPGDVEWPEGTPLDREGRPLDPRVDPVPGSDADTETTKTVSTVFRGTDVQDEAIGWQEGTDLMLDVALEDWADVADAKHVVVFGEKYEIRASIKQGVVIPDRVIVFATSVS